MFKRPSSRRKSSPEEISLNLVPMMDALVTLIAFLLFTMSFLAIVTIESPAPVASKESVENDLKEKPLQLTLTIESDKVLIWSPFERIPSHTIPNPKAGTLDLNAIHQTLISIKQNFPMERKIIFVPNGEITYDSLIGLMDTVRTIEKTDPPLYVKSETGPNAGVDQQVTQLFSDVIFGNLLGELN